MRAQAIHTVFHLKHMVVATILAATLAAATLLAGCAVETPAIGRSTSACGMNAVLYCDLAPHVDRCQCFRHGELRDMMRTLSRR